MPKLATARRQYLRHRADLHPSLRSPWDIYTLRVRVEADLAASRRHEEYEFTEVLRQALREAVPSLEDGEVDQLANVDADQEWAEEMATTYPLRELWSLLERLRRRRPQLPLAIVSDFYVSEERLRELLAHHGWPFDTSMYVSCDRAASKRLNGSLFRLVREEAGVSAERHVHIGDNAVADRDMQLSTGGGRRRADRPQPDAVATAWRLDGVDGGSRMGDLARRACATRRLLRRVPGSGGDGTPRAGRRGCRRPRWRWRSWPEPSRSLSSEDSIESTT